MIFELFSQALSMAVANEVTVFSSNLKLVSIEESIVEMLLITSLMNTFSFALSLAIEYFLL